METFRREKQYANQQVQKKIDSLQERSEDVARANNRKLSTTFQEAMTDLEDVQFQFAEAAKARDLENAYKNLRSAVDKFNLVLTMLSPDAVLETVDMPAPSSAIELEEVILGAAPSKKSEKKRKPENDLPDFAGEPDERWRAEDLREYLRSKSVKTTGLHKHELLRKAQLTYKDRL